MYKFKALLTRIPSWVFTALTTILILWLTLAPDPMGDEVPFLFEGADKIVHGLMFGFLTVMILLDIERKSGWNRLSGIMVTTAILLAAGLGALIEVMQKEMGLGRSFEWQDILSDSIGALVFGGCWWWLQGKWSSAR